MSWGVTEVFALQTHLVEIERLAVSAEKVDEAAVRERLREVQKTLDHLEQNPWTVGTDRERLANKLRTILDGTNYVVQNMVPGMGKRLITVLQRVVYDHPESAST